MSLASFHSNAKEQHPFSLENSMHPYGDTSAESVKLSLLDGYSNLDDVSFTERNWRENQNDTRGKVSSEESSIDESLLRQEVEKVKSGFNTRESSRHSDLICKGRTDIPSGPSNVETVFSPLSQASAYQSVQSVASSATRASWDTATEGESPPASKEKGCDHDVSGTQNSWETSIQDSPSALKASRRSSDQYKDSSKNHTKAPLDGHSLLLTPKMPGAIPRSQSTPSFLTLSSSNSSSTSSPFTINFPLKQRVVQDIFKAAEQLDRAHQEQNNVLLRRIRATEDDNKTLRGQNEDHERERNTYKKHLLLAKELVCQLKERMDTKETQLGQESNGLLQSIYDRLSAPDTCSKTSQNSVSIGHNERDEQTLDSKQSTSERDIELELYVIRQEYESKLEALQTELDRIKYEEREEDTDSRHKMSKEDLDHTQTISRLESELHQVKDQVEQMQQEKESKQHIEGDLRSDFTKVQREKDDLQRLLFETQRELREGQKASLQGAEQQTALHDAEAAAREAQQECRQLKTELQSQWKYAEQHNEHREELQKEIKELKQQLETTSSRVDEGVRAQVQAEALKRDVISATREYTEAREELEEVQKHLGNISQQLEMEIQRSTELSAQKRATEEKLDEVIQLTHNQEEEARSLKQNLQLAEDRIAQYEAKNKDIQSLQNEVQSLRKTIQTNENHLSELTRINEGLVGERDSLQESLHSTQRAMVDLQLEGSTANKGIEAIRKDLSATQNTAQDLRSSLRSREYQITSAYAENAKLDAELKQTKERLEHMKEEQEEGRNEMCSLREQCIRLTSKIHELEQDKQAQGLQSPSPTTKQPSMQDSRLAMVEDELKKSESRVRALEKEVSDRGLSLVKLQKAKRRLEQDNVHFSIALSAKQQELSLVKRNGRRQSSTPRNDATIVSNTLTALTALPEGQSTDPNCMVDESGESLPPLQQGPVLGKFRRKTMERASNLTARRNTEDRKPRHSRRAFSSVVDVKNSNEDKENIANDDQILHSNRSSLSTASVMHGPMELSELSGVPALPSRRTPSMQRRMSQLTSMRAPSASLDGTAKRSTLPVPAL